MKISGLQNRRIYGEKSLHYRPAFYGGTAGCRTPLLYLLWGGLVFVAAGIGLAVGHAGGAPAVARVVAEGDGGVGGPDGKGFLDEAEVEEEGVEVELGEIAFALDGVAGAVPLAEDDGGVVNDLGGVEQAVVETVVEVGFGVAVPL